MAISSSQLTKNLIASLDDKVKKALKGVTKSDLDSLGKLAVDGIKDLAAKGISPIEGKGRFPAYIKADEGGYPITVRKKYPGKKSRPVNLRLSGKFLDEGLEYKSDVSKLTVDVGFFDEQYEVMEQGHRKGTNGQGKRPTIPQGNQTFAQTIMRKFERHVQAIMNRLRA